VGSTTARFLVRGIGCLQVCNETGCGLRGALAQALERDDLFMREVTAIDSVGQAFENPLNRNPWNPLNFLNPWNQSE
jgi:hypothetical protein